MKPIGTKPRPAKFLKVSASFSEQEVEVAEVLFGFARKITCAEESLDDFKVASSSYPSLPPNSLSCLISYFCFSILIGSTDQGSKNKSPSPTKMMKLDPLLLLQLTLLVSIWGMGIISSDNADGWTGISKSRFFFGSLEGNCSSNSKRACCSWCKTYWISQRKDWTGY